MTNTNIIAQIIENKNNAIKEKYKDIKWGLSNVQKLNNILEANNVFISNHVWDLLIFNVNELVINERGQVCYTSFSKPSKKLLKLFKENNDIIVQNFDKLV